MTDLEKVKHIRNVTMSPFKKINEALIASNGNVDKTIERLIKEKMADATDIANRVADTSIVYSYVHNNKIGAMIVLACQTDFVARNESFLQLAKNICIHITSTPSTPLYISKNLIDSVKLKSITDGILAEIGANKPDTIRTKILTGKLEKFYAEHCLLNQKFVKNEELTVHQLIQSISATVGEKIEVRNFVKMTTSNLI